MSRMPPLDPETLSPKQARVYEQIAGRRKTVRGPFPMWLRNPKLAEHANQFGIALRDHSVIGRRIFELCVLVVCRAGSVQYAWSSHAPQAEIAGISPEIVKAIQENRTPEFAKTDERVAYETATEIMRTNNLSQASYDKALAQFGEQGTVELISTIGYYAMVGIFLKSFDVRPPDGSTPLK
ncbi:MAG: carboxymuconolactone decarboxylase family protein [Hyphomicrobiales bacterium]|nr:carboxymuconolactone decarboxylase family protein [Alphaproteobacteria bacterium]